MKKTYPLTYHLYKRTHISHFHIIPTLLSWDHWTAHIFTVRESLSALTHHNWNTSAAHLLHASGPKYKHLMLPSTKLAPSVNRWIEWLPSPLPKMRTTKRNTSKSLYTSDLCSPLCINNCPKWLLTCAPAPVTWRHSAPQRENHLKSDACGTHILGVAVLAHFRSTSSPNDRYEVCSGKLVAMIGFPFLLPSFALNFLPYLFTLPRCGYQNFIKVNRCCAQKCASAWQRQISRVTLTPLFGWKCVAIQISWLFSKNFYWLQTEVQYELRGDYYALIHKLFSN